MTGRFAADLSRFAEMSEAKMRRVMQQSLQDVLTVAQRPVAQGGDMPVRDGFLRNSLVSELDGAEIAQGADSFVLAIAQMEIGQTSRFAWTAAYALPRHYMVGVGQGGGLWRDKAAQQWQAIVERNAGAVQ